ncbi:hypothetical protein [Actinocorallia populi]|uniref:hypothetical protein n=1 Tax=Actinocorallia populi TaxID=2079200 RepID=UPI000D08B31C|nr:hypothetical protein [Actinocorallia populi]
MTFKKFAVASALALGVMGVAGPALAGPQPHPHFGGPDVIAPTSVDDNGLLNNLISLDICGTNVIPIEIIPVVSPTVASCEESQNEDSIEVEKRKHHHHGYYHHHHGYKHDYKHDDHKHHGHKHGH